MREKSKYRITVVCEIKLDASSQYVIGTLSDYISKIVNNKDTILTDIQSFPAGYRITYTIEYLDSIFKKRHYSKLLAKVSDWIYSDEYINCLSRYHYNVSKLT